MADLSENQVTEVLYMSDLNPDDYEDWTSAGMILKSESDSYYSIYSDWSRQSSKFDEQECWNKWQSFNGAPAGKANLTLGTLIYQAKNKGWKYYGGNNSMDKKEIIPWDGYTEKDGEPVYSGDPAENAKIKAKMKKTTPQKEQPAQSRKTQVNNTTETEDKALIKALTAESGKYSRLIENARQWLKDSEAGQAYYKNRGISQETIDHYNAGWIENFANGIAGAVIPGSFEGYGIRNINYEKQLKEYEDKKRDKKPAKYYKPSKRYEDAIDIPVGLKHVIKQPQLKDNKTGCQIPVFIFEGYFDVLSLYEATRLDGISLNGIGNLPKIITALKHFNVERPIVLALDNDETGENKNRKRYEDLLNAGFSVYWIDDFYGEYKDANEYLTHDKDGFIRAIEQAKKAPYNEFESKLNRAQYKKFLEYVDKTEDKPLLKTGFKTLDGEGFLNGGLRAGLYGIGALSSLGKTSFILQLADNLATDGNPVLYFSLEMSRYELMAKSISRYTYESSYDPKQRAPHIAFETLEILDKRNQKNFVEYDHDYLDSCTELYFEDTGDNLRILQARDIDPVDGDVTVEKIKAEVKKQFEVTGRAPVVIIDYLQILAPSKEKMGLSDKAFIDRNVKTLKNISEEFDTPVFFISSFNRQNNNKTGEFESFLGSSGIEYSCDYLFSLERNITLTDKQKAKTGGDESEKFWYAQNVKLAKKRERETGLKWLKLKCLKNRTGRALGEIGILFNARYNHFYDYGEIHEETGTTETFQEESERYDKIMHGKTTIKEAPDPPEVNMLNFMEMQKQEEEPKDKY